MSFGDLGETDLMEIGAGQHGEGGGVRVPMMSSKDTVEHVAGALCKALDLKAGDKTFVMINGLRRHHHHGDAGAVQGHGGVPEGPGH